MKNRLKLLIVMFCGVVISCSESERLIFNEPPSIYFYGTQGGGDMALEYADSISYTFLGKKSDFTKCKTNLKLLVSGYKADKNRVVKIDIDPISNLVKGIDFTIADEIIVPAGALEVNVPISFNRTAKLANDLYYLKFNIVESKDLTPGYATKVSFKFIITEKAIRPSNWPSSYYGDYSAAKLTFMYSILDSDINWGAYPPIHMANSSKLREELAKYERTNGPLMGKVEDGEQDVRVIFPG